MKIIENTLNYVDPRLIDHGKRVAYLVYKVLKRQGKYSKDQMVELMTLALLHDIGAYETEEIDEMVKLDRRGAGAFDLRVSVHKEFFASAAYCRSRFVPPHKLRRAARDGPAYP